MAVGKTAKKDQEWLKRYLLKSRFWYFVAHFPNPFSFAFSMGMTSELRLLIGTLGVSYQTTNTTVSHHFTMSRPQYPNITNTIIRTQ